VCDRAVLSLYQIFIEINYRQFHVYFSQPITCIKWTLTIELKCYIIVRSGDTSVGIETGLQSRKRGAVVRFLTGAGKSSLSKAIRAAVGSIQLPV